MIAGLIVAYGAQEEVEAKTVAEVLDGIVAGSTHRLSVAAKTLAKQFVDYLGSELLPTFDELPNDLGFLPAKDKAGILKKLAQTNLVSRWLAYLLDISTTHQVQSSLSGLVNRLAPERGSVIIKSPVTLDAAFKKTIRKHFKSDFVMFTTDVNLFGGILIYRNGRLIDDSWLGKIKSLSAIKAIKS